MSLGSQKILSPEEIAVRAGEQLSFLHLPEPGLFAERARRLRALAEGHAMRDFLLFVAELAEAFDLDVSTVHRQVAAAMKAGLVERVEDPDGGPARLHRPTEEGRARLAAELSSRADNVAQIVASWPAEDVAEFCRLLRRFNEGAEERRGHPWPRPQTGPGAEDPRL